MGFLRLIMASITGRLRIGYWSPPLGLSPLGTCLMVPLSIFFKIKGILILCTDMYDIATQLAMKWARQGPSVTIEASDDFTRLTLDTLALCAMGVRFNSYYKDKMHPFVYAMTGFLLGSGKRAARPRFLNSLPTQENGQYTADIELMQQVAKDLVEERRNNPSDQRDILNAMLRGRDVKTGEGLNDATIVNNMITFLIAGKEH